MKAIILARVSTEGQKEANNSLPAQEFRLKEYCKNHNFEVIKTFSFDESAYKRNRKLFESVLEYIKKQNEKVVLCCDKVDRLTRGFSKEMLDIEYLRTSGKLELHFASEYLSLTSEAPATNIYHYHNSIVLSAFYSNCIRDNVKRAFDGMVRNGKIIGKAPYGYKNITNPDGTKDVIVIPYELNIVKEIYCLYSNGSYSEATLRKKIFEDHNIKMHKSKMQRILSNPFYCGYRERKGVLYSHNYPAIIDKEMWDKVQALKNGYNTRNSKKEGLPFIYKGIMRCAECGCAITVEKHKGKYIYYHCTDYFKKHTSKLEMIREEELTEQFAKVFEGIKLPEKLVNDIKETLQASNSSKAEIRKEEVNILRQKIDALDKKIKISYDDRVIGRITPEMYDKIYKDSMDEKVNLQASLQRLDKADEDYYITANCLLTICEQAKDLFKNSKLQEKRDMINLVLSNCTLDGKKVLYEAKKPFDSILNLAKNEQWGG